MKWNVDIYLTDDTKILLDDLKLIKYVMSDLKSVSNFTDFILPDSRSLIFVSDTKVVSVQSKSVKYLEFIKVD